MSIKILTILGARPQFIKGATISRVIRQSDNIEEIIVHTGQHFDANMSQVFFEQLDIPKPNYYLGISSLGHGAMTGRMLEKIEELIKQEKPNWVLVYGDTNSTLAGAMAAAKLQVPVAHVEAGLRSHNPIMPEEINRILTDRISSLLLCPTEIAVKNLKQEGFPFPAARLSGGLKLQRIENLGDVMYDAVRHYSGQAKKQVNFEHFGLDHKGYAICTVHRQENTENAERLNSILSALRKISKKIPVILPLHPRTKTKLQQLNSEALIGITIIEPLPYLEMQRLQMSAKLIITDSGGLQKEAYFHQVPCITLRDETEWTETIEAGWNQLVGANEAAIIEAAQIAKPPLIEKNDIYGDGFAANKVVDLLVVLADKY